MKNAKKQGKLAALGALLVGMVSTAAGATGEALETTVPAIDVNRYHRLYETQKVAQACAELGVEFAVQGMFVYVKGTGLSDEQSKALTRIGFAVVKNPDSPNAGNLFHPGPKLNPDRVFGEKAWQRGPAQAPLSES